MEGKNQVNIILATIVISSIFGMCLGAVHTVGGSTGWTIPTSASFYPTWASSQTFRVGDVLVFNFPAGAHTVAQVNKQNFDSCSTGSTIGAVQTTAPANITLTSAGTHYFICTIPGHCSGNQKLSVLVTAASTTSPATSPATPPTPSRRTPVPAASPTTPTGGATAPAASPTTPTGGATTPATSPTASAGGATSPSGSPIIPGAEGPSTPSAPAPSFATSTNVGLLSMMSVAFAALLF